MAQNRQSNSILLQCGQVESRTVSVRTLVVEDSVSARGIIKQRLEAIGCEIVATAPDSATALELVRELRPQLVTLDLIMPETGSLHAKEIGRQTCALPISIGCEIVATAPDSATALELVRELRPQLVTLDLIMPETGSLHAK